MNIFHKYTLQNLKKNKTRTLVTIIGIILSVAMFTATTEALASAQHYMLSYIEKTEGTFHARYSALDIDQYTSLKNDDQVKQIGSFQEIGFCELDQEKYNFNDYEEYLHVGGIDEAYPELTALDLAGGRLPQNENEIVLPLDYFIAVYPDSSPGDFDYSKNETVTLKIGQRTSPSKKLLYTDVYEEGEKLTDVYEKKYTIVGVCYPNSLGTEIDSCCLNAYTVRNESSVLPVTAFFRLNRISKVDSFSSDNESLYPKERCSVHSNILTYSGIIKDPGIAIMFYGLAAVLFALIMFGSVSLIYNSFSISVSERTKQFGLLKSIGATKKQIMHTVNFEAVVLCLCAIPIGLISGCLGIGVTFICLGDSFNKFFNQPSLEGSIEMRLHIAPIALIVAVLISVVTTLISAYIPAKRAIRISAIEAIRQSNDITTTKARTVKTSRLTLKLFGFEGMLARKNFKRSKKRYRTTVISLFMSIVLFISATSLCHYFTQGFNAQKEVYTYDVFLQSHTVQSDYETKRENLVKELDKIEEITEYTDVHMLGGGITTSGKNTTDKYLSFMGAEKESSVLCDLSILFVDDKAFDKYLKENGIDAEKLDKNSDTPPAIVYDTMRSTSYDGNKQINSIFPIFSFEKTPVEIDLNVFSEETDDYYYTGETKTENGETYYKFNLWDDDDEKNTEKWLNEKDIIKTQNANIVLRAEEKPYFTGYNTCAVVFAKSSMDKIVKNTDGELLQHEVFYFKVADHTAASEKIREAVKNCNLDYSNVHDYMEEEAAILALITIIRVFSYGFITLISLIALANVFNTISTNVLLRRREMAMLKSVGMTDKGFSRMMSYESILYGVKSLLLGLPVSVLASFGMYYIVRESGKDVVFNLPISSMLIAIVSVFIVVFASMIYSMRKIKKENTIDALKNENI